VAAVFRPKTLEPFRPLGLACALALVACAGGPQFDGREYRGDGLAFRIGPVPTGLRLVQSDDARLAFRNDDDGSTVVVNARCRLDGDDVPLRALVQHLFLQFTDRTLLGERAFRLDGRDALEVEIEASLDGVRRHFVVTVLKKDGCVYDFVLVDRPHAAGGEAGRAAHFRRLVEGFVTLD